MISFEVIKPVSVTGECNIKVLESDTFLLATLPVDLILSVYMNYLSKLIILLTIRFLDPSPRDPDSRCGVEPQDVCV